MYHLTTEALVVTTIAPFRCQGADKPIWMFRPPVVITALDASQAKTFWLRIGTRRRDNLS